VVSTYDPAIGIERNEIAVTVLDRAAGKATVRDEIDLRGF
jgi:hypothetical protein